MLLVQHLTHERQQGFGLRDINFVLGDGEKLAVLGLHDSGKSLLLEILAGYIIPQQGSIHIHGCDLRYDAQEARKYFGYVPSHPTINAEWTVAETMQLFARIRELPFPRDAALARVERWGLRDMYHEPVESLHYGQQMRLLLALATLHEPELILLDDPFQGLDPKELHSIISTLGREYTRSSIVLATNKLEALPRWIDRVIVLDQGSIALDQAYNGIDSLLPALAEVWKEPYGDDQENLDPLSP